MMVYYQMEVILDLWVSKHKKGRICCFSVHGSRSHSIGNVSTCIDDMDRNTACANFYYAALHVMQLWPNEFIKFNSWIQAGKNMQKSRLSLEHT